MRIFNFPQNSPEWYSVRTGAITASQFASVLDFTKAGKPGADRVKLLNDKVMERLTGDLTDHFTNFAMKRGTELEPDAASAYESATGSMTTEIGFVMDDTLRIGCSPDRLVGDAGIIEIKCPFSATEMLRAWLDTDAFVAGYEPQIRGQLWLAEREWCDLVVYHPKLPLFIHRLFRDAGKERELSDKVIEFEAEVTRRTDDMRAKFRENQA